MSSGRQRAILIAAVLVALGYGWLRGAFDVRAGGTPRAADVERHANAPGFEVATLAAGCFWCAEADFEKLDGVVSVTSGYTGGHDAHPTYRTVSRGTTGHTEAVEIRFDRSVLTYERLLDHFWRNVDPFAAHSQFCDIGDQYRPALFTHGEAQRLAADASKARVEKKFGRPVAVQVAAAGAFYPAEDEHQDYARRNPVRYRYYRWGCGRDRRLRELWGPS